MIRNNGLLQHSTIIVFGIKLIKFKKITIIIREDIFITIVWLIYNFKYL